MWSVCQTLIVELIVNVLCADLVVVVSSVTWIVGLGVLSQVRSLVGYPLGSVMCARVSHEWYVLWLLVIVRTLLVVAKGIVG